MEKIQSREVKSTEIVHKFYCDCCNEFISESYECDDGYYRDETNCFMRFYSDGTGWLELLGCFCEKCKKEKEEKVINFLKENGFVKG